MFHRFLFTQKAPVCVIGTFRFSILAMSWMSISDPVIISFAPLCRRKVSVHKHISPHFGGDISDRSIIYPMGRPFCFRDNPNNNVIPTLLIISECTQTSTAANFTQDYQTAVQQLEKKEVNKNQCITTSWKKYGEDVHKGPHTTKTGGPKEMTASNQVLNGARMQQ